MDYRMIVEDMMSEVYQKGYTGDNDTFNRVMSRNKNRSSGKRRIKKLPAMAASAAALGILTVSAGAAINWDIHSLLGYYNDARQSASAEHKATTKWYPERDMYDIDGSLLYAKTANYDYILSKIVHPVDKLCEYDKADIYISGYAYDGYIVELYYDVTPKKRSSIHKDEETYTQTDFYSYVEPADKSMGGSSLCYATEGNTKKCMSRFHYRLPDDVSGSLFLLMPDDLQVETQVTYEELESRYLDCAFMIEKPDIPGYVLDLSPDVNIGLSDDITAKVVEMHISPLSLEFGCMISPDSAESGKTPPTPLYIEYNDGTVLDLSQWTAPEFVWKHLNYNGKSGFYQYSDTNGNLLDVTQIKSVKLFDTTINING